MNLIVSIVAMVITIGIFTAEWYYHDRIAGWYHWYITSIIRTKRLSQKIQHAYGGWSKLKTNAEFAALEKGIDVDRQLSDCNTDMVEALWQARQYDLTLHPSRLKHDLDLMEKAWGEAQSCIEFAEEVINDPID